MVILFAVVTPGKSSASLSPASKFSFGPSRTGVTHYAVVLGEAKLSRRISRRFLKGLGTGVPRLRSG